MISLRKGASTADGGAAHGALPVDAGLLAASPVTYARLAQQKF